MISGGSNYKRDINKYTLQALFVKVTQTLISAVTIITLESTHRRLSVGQTVNVITSSCKTTQKSLQALKFVSEMCNHNNAISHPVTLVKILASSLSH